MKLLAKLNFKTIYFNLKYLPFRQAVKLPILLSRKVYLREMKGKITIEGPIETGLIKIGYGKVGIFDNRRSRSIWEVSGEVVFKGKANIGHGSKISVGKEGKLVLGSRFVVTAESSIVAHHSVEIGDDCLFSWDILLMDTDFHEMKNETGAVMNAPKPVKIGNKVWIGCRVLILKGTEIPDGCVIGANSSVSKKLEMENSLYVGQPCRLSKSGISWLT